MAMTCDFHAGEAAPGAVVRRVKDRNRTAARDQGELWPVWRYHAVFTDSPLELVQAEEQHRGYAIVEQMFADWADGPLLICPPARLPRMRPGSRPRRNTAAGYRIKARTSTSMHRTCLSACIMT